MDGQDTEDQGLGDCLFAFQGVGAVNKVDGVQGELGLESVDVS